MTSRGLGGNGAKRSMITERGGTGNAGSIFVITEYYKETFFIFKNIHILLIILPCVPTGGGSFGGASRITIGGKVGGGGGRCPKL